MAASRSTRRDQFGRPDRRLPARTGKWLLRILGGGCALFGGFALIGEDHAGWTYGSLVMCGLLLAATSVVITRRGNRERFSPARHSSVAETMSTSDLSSMTPPGWDAIPATVSMAAQPDGYFRHRKVSSDVER